MKQEVLDDIFRKHGVIRAYLFGSQKEAGIAFLEGMAAKIDDEVDLDIGVVFKIFPEDAFGAYGELYADLSLFFEPFAVDLVFLQETNALFQYEAITGELIYCSGELFLEEYEEYVMKMASDLSFKKIQFERDFLEAAKDGYFEITHRQD
jgi:predicted nucleotidyltransferase